MFRKILFCTDLTPASDALIDCIAVLKRVGTEEVVLAHAVQPLSSHGTEAQLFEEAGRGLERQKKALEELGLRVTLETPFGHPAEVLNLVAHNHEVGAILVGSHGKGVIKTATLGSVSAELLNQTKFPVFLARMDLLQQEKGASLCSNLFRNVLFATDFSQPAERALDYLGKIALETGCPVTLMHVLDLDEEDPDRIRRMEEDARYLLEAKKRRLVTLGASEVTVDLVYGDPAQEIASRTGMDGCSMVVMGRHGKGVLEEIFMGSTANQVARHASVPLLFIPALD